MKKLTSALVALVVLGTMATFVPSAGAATDVPFTDDNVTNVKTGGSDTTYLVMNNLAKAYNESEGCTLNSVAIKATPPSTVPQQNRCVGATTPEGAGQTAVVRTENYDHDLVINYFPQGSGAGRAQLCAQLPVTDPNRLPQLVYLDVARSSSAPSASFQCTVDNGAPVPAGQRVLRFIAFAKDALTWVHWNTPTGGSTGVSNLTVQNIKDIWFNCTITNWNQVGGGNAPINVYTMVSSSGSRATWDAFVGGNSTTCIPAAFKDGNLANGERVIREHYANPVEEAVNDPAAADEGNSIYPFSVGLHGNPALAQSSLLGDINGITADEGTIVSGTFPFTRLLYNIIINAGPSPVASEATRRFTNMRNWTGPAQNEQLGWICKPLNAHSKPDGDAGVGITSQYASFNYASEEDKALRSTGFFPIETDPTLPRCSFTDVRVDQSAQTPI